MDNIEKSRYIAGIIGPVLIVTAASELKVWNPRLYDDQIAPLVYVSGILLFVAGVSIVRAHHRWSATWPVLITITGYAGIVLGSARALFPHAYLSGFKNDVTVSAFEIALIAIGAFLTIKAYWRSGQKRAS